MKKLFIFILLCALVLPFWACTGNPPSLVFPTPTSVPAPPAAPSPVRFPDANLEQVIRLQIGKPSGDIFPADVANIETLALQHLGSDEERIENIAGMEYFESLRELDFSGHRIKNLRPLAGLKALQRLDLSENLIEDVTALQALTNLNELRLYKNRITEISALRGLTKLTYLYLSENYYLSDISAVSSFTELTGIGLSFTNVSDISPLGSLRSLSSLPMMDHTPVWDVSPLTDNLPTLLENRKNELSGSGYTAEELEKMAADIRDIHEKNLEAGQFIQKTLAGLITPGMTELEREFAIFNFVAKRLEYDLVAGFNSTSDLYSAFVTGRGICGHYALAFRVLCNAAGLACHIVRGFADNGDGVTEHFWNIVRIDGEYYQVDVTWADSTEIDYDYFNRSTAAMYALGARSSERPDYDKDCPRDMPEESIRTLVPGYVRNK